MSGPKFNGQISLGNILTFIGMLAAVGVSWMTMQANIAENAMANKRQDEAIKALWEILESDRAQLVQLEIANARTDERINIIVQGIAEIKASLSQRGP